MGKYDALFADDEEPSKKPKGKYAGLFDEPAPAAKPFPWETEAAPTGRQFSPAAQGYDANIQALAATPRPGLLDNLKQTGGNIVQGAKTLANISAESSTPRTPLQAGAYLIPGVGPLVAQSDFLSKNPEKRRELERGISDVTTGGLAEKAARAVGERVGDPSFSQQQAQSDAAAAPGVRQAGALAGSALPSPVQFVAGEVGAAIPGRGALPGAVRSIAQYEATAPGMAALSAEPGHRLEAASQAAGDPAGLILSGGTGAIGGYIGRTPERVKEVGKEAVSRGEAGGTVGKVGKRASIVAGEGGENLYEQIGNDLPLEAGQSVLAKSHPGIVAKQYTRRLDKLAEQTEPYYTSIDNAPDPRFANPAKAPKNGGVDLGRVEERLQGSMDKALAEGRGYIADAYDRALAKLRNQYGTDGKITPGEKLPARSMRNYANELGEGLMPATDDPQTRTLAMQAKRAIQRDVVGAIEDEGERVGLDMSELRKLNKKIFTFATTRDALAARAEQAAQGKTTAGNLLTSVLLPTAGAMSGSVEGFAAGVAAEGVRRLGMPTVRAGQFAMAKLVQASRAGANPGQLGAMALQLGVSNAVADRISRGGLAALNEQPASERDYTQP